MTDRRKKLAQYEYMLSRPEMFDLGLPFQEEDIDVPFGIYESPRSLTESIVSEISAYANDLGALLGEDYFWNNINVLEDWEDKSVPEHADLAFDLLSEPSYEVYLDNAFSMIEDLMRGKIKESLVEPEQLNTMVAAIYTKGFLNMVREAIGAELEEEFASRRDGLKEEYVQRQLYNQKDLVEGLIDETLAGIDAYDLNFDPAYLETPGTQYPEIVYDIAHKIVNRLDFLEWEDVEGQDHWLWELIVDRVQDYLDNIREDYDDYKVE